MPEWLRNKLFKGQRPQKETMLILFLCGILLFVILLPVNESGSQTAATGSYKKNSASNDEQASTDSTDARAEEMSLQEYKEMMEAELEEFLSGMSGVGEVKALICMKASREYNVEKDALVNGESQNEETVYTVNESGQEVPFITRYICPQIEGVAVIAQGAADEEVRLRLVRLIMTLYGLEANKVEVTN